MKILKNEVYETQDGLLLKVQKVNDCGTHIFKLVDEKGKDIKERRNHRGHVTLRATRVCTNETVLTFKKVK
jgi:hypothetical protein